MRSFLIPLCTLALLTAGSASATGIDTHTALSEGDGSCSANHTEKEEGWYDGHSSGYYRHNASSHRCADRFDQAGTGASSDGAPVAGAWLGSRGGSSGSRTTEESSWSGPAWCHEPLPNTTDNATPCGWYGSYQRSDREASDWRSDSGLFAETPAGNGQVVRTGSCQGWDASSYESWSGYGSSGDGTWSGGYGSSSHGYGSGGCWSGVGAAGSDVRTSQCGYSSGHRSEEQGYSWSGPEGYGGSSSYNRSYGQTSSCDAGVSTQGLSAASSCASSHQGGEAGSSWYRAEYGNSTGNETGNETGNGTVPPRPPSPWYGESHNTTYQDSVDACFTGVQATRNVAGVDVAARAGRVDATERHCTWTDGHGGCAEREEHDVVASVRVGNDQVGTLGDEARFTPGTLFG